MPIISGPYPGTFDTAASEILVSGTSFNGQIVNQGVIGSGGVVFIDGIVGGVLSNGSFFNNGGTVLGGIRVDSNSQILAGSSAAIFVETQRPSLVASPMRELWPDRQVSSMAARSARRRSSRH